MGFLKDLYTGPQAPAAFEWVSGKYADWKVRVQDKTYHLHRVILAEGPRGCDMFSAAFNAAYEGSGTDLTHLLPQQCHAAFETALDFIYGKDKVVNDENACLLMKIGEVLQCGALLRECGNVMLVHLSDQHAEEWLQEASALNLKAVVAPCLERMINLKGPSNLKNLEHWAKVDEDICIEILSKDDLQVEEDDVAEFVMRVVGWLEDPRVQQSLWSTVRFAGVSDAVLQKVEPSPSNFEAMAKGLRAKCLGETPHWRGSYWTSVMGRGHVAADGRLVEFQAAGTAQSFRHRCTIQLLKCENGAGSAIGFATKEAGRDHIMCSEGGFASGAGASSYAISVFSNGMGNVEKWETSLTGPEKCARRSKPVLHFRHGQKLCAVLGGRKRQGWHLSACGPRGRGKGIRFYCQLLLLRCSLSPCLSCCNVP